MEYQKFKLEQYGFVEKGGDDEFPTFTRTAKMENYDVMSEIEIKASPDPDLSTYKALIRVVKDGATQGRLETDRRFKLVDVIAEVTKIEALLKGLDRSVKYTDQAF